MRYVIVLMNKGRFSGESGCLMNMIHILGETYL